MAGRYRMRTRVRRHLPWFLINLGIADQGREDCGDHEWHNADYLVEHCYHCVVGVRPYDRAHFEE